MARFSELGISVFTARYASLDVFLTMARFYIMGDSGMTVYSVTQLTTTIGMYT